MLRKIASTILVPLTVGVLVGVFLLPDITQNLPEDTPTAVKIMADALLPIYFVVIVLGAMATFAGTAIVYRYHKWNEFGKRLKEAYAAKYGYMNPAYNEQVDIRVRAMRALSRHTLQGTKEANEEALKQLAHMVEVKYVIPFEDRLSETEKTELIAKEGEE